MEEQRQQERRLHPARQEFRQRAQELLRSFEVRHVPGAIDLDQLSIREFLDGSAARKERFHEGSIAVRSLRHLGRKKRRERLRRNRAAIVFEPDRIFENKRSGHVRIGACKIDREHAAERVADDRSALDAQRVQQFPCVRFLVFAESRSKE